MGSEAPVMDVRPCGSQGLMLSAQGFGCMSLTKGFYASEEHAPSKEDAKACLLRALQLGVTFYNSSNIYGPYINEELIGETIEGLSPRPTIMTKWGPMFKPGQGPEGGIALRTDPKYARECIEGQLERLGVECIDLWVLRGFNEQETSVEETMAGVKELMEEGKFKYMGLSEVSPDQIRRAHAVVPITALEIEWSLWERRNEDDVIPLARELGIGIVPWGPMGTGFLTGQFTSWEDLKDGDFRKVAHKRMTKEAFVENNRLVERLKVLADKKGCTPAQLALAWVHAQGEDVFPIPGTKRVKYLEQNAAAYAISKTLTKADLAELEAAVPAHEGLKLSAQGFGCMSLTKGFYASEANAPSKEDARACLLRALELGVTFYNTSILYGPYVNEELIGETIKGMAKKPTIMTKWGPMITDKGFVHHTDRETAREQIGGQLQRLGTDSIDLWVLRGFNEKETSVEDTMAAVKELVDEGKVKYVGLSECSVDEVRRAHAIVPISALEIEWSLWERGNEEDVIPLARELGIGIVPWGPMGAGFLTGAFTSRADFMEGDIRGHHHSKMSEENFDKNLAIVERIKALAEKKGCLPGQLALAWVHAQGDDVFPIPGTKRVKYLEQNAEAYHISKTLTKEELAELEAAVPKHEIHGEAISNVRKKK